jgi:hypothetical protein
MHPLSKKEVKMRPLFYRGNFRQRRFRKERLYEEISDKAFYIEEYG